MSINKTGTKDAICAEKTPSQWQMAEKTRRHRLSAQKLIDASKSKFEDRLDAARWYCIAVNRSKELVLEESLKAADVDVYVPRERYETIKKGKKIEGDHVVLSGYMMVRLLPSARAFSGLKSLNGVIDFIGNETGYHIIPAHEVEKLKALYERNDICRMPVDRSIGQGSKAKIAHGPFAGKDCVVVQVASGRSPKVKIWIEAFGDRIGVVTLPLAFLQKL